MSPLAEFLEILLRDGQAVLRGRPSLPSPQDAEALGLLQRAYAIYRLRVTGPPLPFEPEITLAAASLLQHACWFLVNRVETEAVLEQTLILRSPSGSPQEHLSADLVLRFLPQVHRRARAHNPADRLPGLLAEILRHWPLSGVLSGVEEAPLSPVAFGNHPGLLLLYAERLAQHQKPAWVPGGLGRSYLELVLEELGKDPRTLLEAAQPPTLRQ